MISLSPGLPNVWTMASLESGPSALRTTSSGVGFSNFSHEHGAAGEVDAERQAAARDDREQPRSDDATERMMACQRHLMKL